MAEADLERDSACNGGLRDSALAEARAIAASAEFARAPVMRRLLDFLITETIAGRGDQLKAYAVAVDGLGRAANFDAQGDSYPRVQVGRLRKMLESYYAANPPAAGAPRLSIPQGRYRIAFGTGEPEPAPAEETLTPETAGWRRRAAPILLAALLLVLAAAAFLWVDRSAEPQAGAAAADPQRPPVLELGRLEAPDLDPEQVEALRSTLLDALRRSPLVRVTARRRTGQPDPAPLAARYRLATDIRKEDGLVLYFRLWRLAPDRLLWSEQLHVRDDGEEMRTALAPIIAAIVQPYGVIATNERDEYGEDMTPGYTCLLQFDHYRAVRTAALHGAVSACLARTIENDQNNASALAAASVMATDEKLFGFAGPPDDPLARSLALARRAVVADPFSALAHFAMARASLRTGSCAVAVRSGMRAIALNPYDPILQTDIGMFLLDCDDPRAEETVRHAMALDPNVAPRGYLPLVYAAINRGDGAAAHAAAAQIAPATSDAPALVMITQAVAAAAANDTAGARAIWQRLRARYPGAAHDPGGELAHWTLAPRIREKSVAHLARAGLIPAPDAPIR